MRVFRVWLSTLLLCGCAVAANPAASGNLTPDPWFRYLSAQGHAAPWAGTVRGKDRGSQDSLRLAGEGDLIVPVDWGLRSGKDARAVAGHVERLRNGRFADDARALGARVGQLERAHRGRIYWQIGNEINSRSMSRSLAAAAGVGPLMRVDDPATVPLYAEFLFAPAAEALRGTSKALYGDPQRIRVVLGSIANIHRASARDWLLRLLDYRLVGTYAPTLAGRRVADLVAVVAVHYAATADDPPWQDVFDGIGMHLAPTGARPAIWATEELGKRRAAQGLGAATAVRVASACLSRAAERTLDATALRCSLYGWSRGRRGTTGDDGMRLLLSAFGQARVEYLGPLQVPDAGDGPESRVFRPESGAGGCLAVIHGRAGGDAMLAGFSFPGPPCSPAARLVGTLLGPHGEETIGFVARPPGTGGPPQYRPSRPVVIGRGETLLIRELP